MRSQTSPSPQEGQRLTLHEEGSGSFLRIHRSYSHPTGEVTPLGTTPVPRCPPWCSPSTLRAQHSSCWQLPPRCPPSQGQHPDPSSLCCRPPTLPVGLPKTPHAPPPRLDTSGCCEPRVYWGMGVQSPAWGQGGAGGAPRARDRAGGPRMDTGMYWDNPGWALGTVRC